MGKAMNAVIEMFREGAESYGFGRFSCSLQTWELLHELGETFGWRPRGTTYAEPAGRKGPSPATRNYQPGASLDRKWVDAEDARAWAAALDVARQSPHALAMIDARSAAWAGDIDQRERDELRLIVDRFVEFLYIGAFEFAVANAEGRQRE